MISHNHRQPNLQQTRAQPVVRGTPGHTQKVSNLGDGSLLVDVETPKPVGIWSFDVHKCRSGARNVSKNDAGARQGRERKITCVRSGNPGVKAGAGEADW